MRSGMWRVTLAPAHDTEAPPLDRAHARLWHALRAPPHAPRGRAARRNEARARTVRRRRQGAALLAELAADEGPKARRGGRRARPQRSLVALRRLRARAQREGLRRLRVRPTRSRQL